MPIECYAIAAHSFLSCSRLIMWSPLLPSGLIFKYATDHRPQSVSLNRWTQDIQVYKWGWWGMILGQWTVIECIFYRLRVSSSPESVRFPLPVSRTKLSLAYWIFWRFRFFISSYPMFWFNDCLCCRPRGQEKNIRRPAMTRPHRTRTAVFN